MRYRIDYYNAYYYVWCIEKAVYVNTIGLSTIKNAEKYVERLKAKENENTT